jgi:multidrug efflux system membrane fusion protein
MESQSSGSASSVPASSALPPVRSKRRRWVWVLVISLFALVFYLVLRHHNDPTQASQAARRGPGGPVTINTATAKKGDIGVYLSAIGTVTPVYTSAITSQVSGMISAVHYREAQLVRKGDPLVDIDPRPFQAQLEQAEGTLERDTHILEQSRMDLERYQKAWSRNAIAKQTLDDQEKIVLQNQGTVKNDQGVVDYDGVQLGYCHITAPYDGRVGLRLIDPGNVVQANSSTTPLVVITQLQPITVIFTLAEDYLGQIQSELRHGVPLRVEAYDRALLTKIATGKLLAVDNQIDTTTGTVRLRAQFENKHNELFPNQFVNTRLLVSTQNDATLIPTSAIQHNGPNAFVYLIANDTAQIQPIKPGVEDSGITAVEGIKPGDIVANSSFEKLQNNAKVKISSAPIPSSSVGVSTAP